jgi:hypothetical protein
LEGQIKPLGRILYLPEQYAALALIPTRVEGMWATGAAMVVIVRVALIPVVVVLAVIMVMAATERRTVARVMQDQAVVAVAVLVAHMDGRVGPAAVVSVYWVKVLLVAQVVVEEKEVVAVTMDRVVTRLAV